MMIFREVWARLTRDSRSCFQYGPKPQDVYHSPPYRYAGDRSACTTDIVCDDNSSILLDSTGIRIDFSLERYDDRLPSGLFIACSLEEPNFTAALLHVVAAKYISMVTGLAEQSCRQMWAHVVEP
eukprot:2471320-Rhodomonas_salina.1